MLVHRPSRRTPVRDEGGASALELVVAAALLIVVITPVYLVLGSGVRTQAGHQERAELQDALGSVLDDIGAELRQAQAVDETSDADTLTIQTIVGGASASVTYDASGGVLTRTVDGGAPVLVLSGVVSPHDVFVYDIAPGSDPGPSVVGVRLAVDATGSRPIEATADAHLRNADAP